MFILFIVLVSGAEVWAQAPTATTGRRRASVPRGPRSTVLSTPTVGSSTVTFEYGTPTVAYGTTVMADQSPVTGSIDTAVRTALSGLTSNTTYPFRVVGTNAGGTTFGADMTFTTSHSPHGHHPGRVEHHHHHGGGTETSPISGIPTPRPTVSSGTPAALRRQRQLHRRRCGCINWSLYLQHYRALVQHDLLCACLCHQHRRNCFGSEVSFTTALRPQPHDRCSNSRGVDRGHVERHSQRQRRLNDRHLRVRDDGRLREHGDGRPEPGDRQVRILLESTVLAGLTEQHDYHFTVAATNNSQRYDPRRRHSWVPRSPLHHCHAVESVMGATFTIAPLS